MKWLQHLGCSFQKPCSRKGKYRPQKPTEDKVHYFYIPLSHKSIINVNLYNYNLILYINKKIEL